MAPAVKGPQPLSGSYLIHTSSSLIWYSRAAPSVAQGMDYLIRERLEHPPGSFVIMPGFCCCSPLETLIKFVLCHSSWFWDVEACVGAFQYSFSLLKHDVSLVRTHLFQQFTVKGHYLSCFCAAGGCSVNVLVCCWGNQENLCSVWSWDLSAQLIACFCFPKTKRW